MANKRETIKLLEELVEERIKEIRQNTNKIIAQLNEKKLNIKREAFNPFRTEDNKYLIINGLTIPTSNIYFEGATNPEIKEIESEIIKVKQDGDNEIKKLKEKLITLKRETILNGLSDEIKNTIKKLLNTGEE